MGHKLACCGAQARVLFKSYEAVIGVINEELTASQSHSDPPRLSYELSMSLASI